MHEAAEEQLLDDRRADHDQQHQHDHARTAGPVGELAGRVGQLVGVDVEDPEDRDIEERHQDELRERADREAEDGVARLGPQPHVGREVAGALASREEHRPADEHHPERHLQDGREPDRRIRDRRRRRTRLRAAPRHPPDSTPRTRRARSRSASRTPGAVAVSSATAADRSDGEGDRAGRPHAAIVEHPAPWAGAGARRGGRTCRRRAGRAPG